MDWAWLKHTFPGELLRRCRVHGINQHSAALAYYLFFSVFPLLIFLSNCLGVLQLDAALVEEQLQTLLPPSAAELAGDYFAYVSGGRGRALLVFSLLFSLYFPYRAVNALMIPVQRAFRCHSAGGMHRQRMAALLAALLLLTITAGLVALVLGRSILSLLQCYIPLSKVWVELWLWLRFAAPTVLLWGLVALLYHWAAGKTIPMADLWPGVLVAMLGWLGATFAFSCYVEYFANYSLIYGSISAVIVLLLWLKLTAVLMIMGAEFDMIRLDRKNMPPGGKRKDRNGI